MGLTIFLKRVWTNIICNMFYVYLTGILCGLTTAKGEFTVFALILPRGRYVCTYLLHSELKSTTHSTPTKTDSNFPKSYSQT